MNTSSSDVSQANAERLEVRQDDDIARSEIPEVTEAHMARAIMGIGGVPVERCVPFGQEYISGDLHETPIVKAYGGPPQGGLHAGGYRCLGQ